MGPTHKICHPVVNGRLPEPVRHDLESVDQVGVASDVIDDELSKVVRRQPDAVEDQLKIGVTGQLAPDTVESSVDRAGVRLGHDKPIDLIKHDPTLDQPCQHVDLLTRTSRDIDEAKIDDGSHIGMHDDLPVDNRKDSVECRRLGHGRGGDEDRRNHHTDNQPAEAAGGRTPIGTSKKPGRY